MVKIIYANSQDVKTYAHGVTQYTQIQHHNQNAYNLQMSLSNNSQN